MGIFKDWIMVSDIDGTLIGDDCLLHEEDVSAVKDFVNNDGTFVLATGRSVSSAFRFYQQLQLNTPMIANNGTIIHDFSKSMIVYTDELDNNAEALVQYVFDNYPDAGIEIYSTNCIYFLRHNQMVKEHIERENLEVVNRTLDTADKPWCKVLFAIDPPLMDEFRKFIYASPFCNDFLFAQSAPFFFEAAKLGASKGKAVSHLIKSLGFTAEKTITIGDNENDANMLSFTNHSFAVANATEYAKAAAKHQTKAAGTKGGAVAEAIQTIRDELLKGVL